MIGSQTITVKSLPKTGDKEDFNVNLTGPDPKTNFSFPVTVSGTAVAIWGDNPQQAVKTLVGTIFDVVGTATAPPTEGFWFDSYNSGETVRETENIIRNQGPKQFIKNRSIYAWLLGDKTFKVIIDLDSKCTKKFKQPFFSSLEEIGEQSQILNDLNSPPMDNAHFLYRICLLSGIIDHIQIKDQNSKISCPICKSQIKGNLQCMREWLGSIIDKNKANDLVQALQMIKNLRKQYPIHDHFDTKLGVLKTRKEIEKAVKYFGITDNKVYSDNWTKILNAFKGSLVGILNSLFLTD